MKILYQIFVPVLVSCFFINQNVRAMNSGKPTSLKFNNDKYQVKEQTINGLTIRFRAFENIVYISHPVDTTYEIMNFYVPEAYYEGKSINGFNKGNAPIFMPNKVGGYMPSKPGKTGKKWSDSNDPNAAFIALSKGFIVAEPGARGRTTKNKDGIYTGKAPACIIDLKAAVAYLHLNDKRMPGDANKIITNGTSAGGALSALLGATGNNFDYKPYLKEIGAADASDAIFAVSAYCPITNLDHADMAYEWDFNGINNFKSLKFIKDTDYKIKRVWSVGVMNEQQINLSDELAKLFPEYLNSLNLMDNTGEKLTLDTDGNGSFKAYLKKFILKSAQKALDNDSNLAQYNWLTIQKNKVIDFDFDNYKQYVKRMKVTPAFDGVDLNTPENDLFGSGKIQAKHFTSFSLQHSNDKLMADPDIIKMMNPMSYIGKPGSSFAKFWRIRHGAIDSDTALAIPLILATKLLNNGHNVDFDVPWGTPHSGDYDLEEFFNWMIKISK